MLQNRWKYSLALLLSGFFWGVAAQNNGSIDETELNRLLQLGLPVVWVETVGGEEPAYEVAYAPEGCWGTSIKNATKVPGRVMVFDTQGLLFDSGDYVEKTSGMTIKVRGNGSALFDKKPFKIKLQKKGDMLNRGDDGFADKNWLLLCIHNNLPPNLMIGLKVNELCGLQWTPQYKLVNFVFNGDFRGLYALTESVDRNATRLDVDKKTGFIAELDAYWWNEDFYVPSSYSDPLNYTFKYPDVEDMSEEQKAYLAEILPQMEQSAESDSYEKIIDVESFACWMLAHDILGNIDGAGSNIYLTKYDNTENSLIKMGCLWDFDATMLSDDWDAAHNNYFFKALWGNSNQLFSQKYNSLWESEKDRVFTNLFAFLDALSAPEQAQIIDNALAANAERWEATYTPWLVSVEKARNFFKTRKLWLETAIPNTTKIAPIKETGSRNGSHNNIFSLTGVRLQDTKEGSRYLSKGIYICDGKKVVVR